MRILFIAPYVPSRIRVRPFHIIKELAKRHKMHVLALGVPNSEKREGVEELQNVVEDFRVLPHSSLRGAANSLLALPTRVPMCAAYCRSGAMTAEVRRALAESPFDLVHVEHLRAAHFASRDARLPMVFDSVDCLSNLFAQMARTAQGCLRRLVAAEEAWKLRRYEPAVLSRFDAVVITSDVERDKLIVLDSALRVETVPNGVDTDYFAPQGTAKSPRRIILTGKMGYRPNAEAAIWFAEQVFGRLRDRWSDTEFVIVGNDPPESVRRLASRPGISVTGYVPDMRPHLDAAAVAVAPMRVAVGVQNKVLEAMAMGLPVVMSPLAARTSASCESAVIADSPDEWFTAVSRLIERPDEAAEIGRRNRDYVVVGHSWETMVRKLESVYERVLSRRSE